MSDALKRAAKSRLPVPPKPKPRKNYDNHPTGADFPMMKNLITGEIVRVI